MAPEDAASRRCDCAEYDNGLELDSLTACAASAVAVRTAIHQLPVDGGDRLARSALMPRQRRLSDAFVGGAHRAMALPLQPLLIKC